MAARAIWKGVITFGDVKLPVKLYSAVQDRDVHFNLLHDQDMERVKQRMVNSATGEEVPSDRIRKGLQTDTGRFVLLSEEDLKSLEPPESREIRIDKFVDPQEINHQWYERPYYLGPDEGAGSDYWTVVDALDRQNKEGVAHWTMRRRAYVGALRAERGYLILNTTRHPDEVIDVSDLEAPKGRKADPRELKMAEQLVSALADKFDPTEYRDEYRARVMDLIERKARGEKIELRKVEQKETTRSLVSALEASLAAVGKGGEASEKRGRRGSKKEKVHA